MKEDLILGKRRIVVGRGGSFDFLCDLYKWK